MSVKQTGGSRTSDIHSKKAEPPKGEHLRQLERRTEEYMIAQGMLGEDISGGILAAVSGGADSTALLLVLSELRKKYKFPLLAVHVHHGIRGEAADRDADFTRQLAGRLGVDFRLRKIDVPKYADEQKKTLEEAAREERYRVLREEKERFGAKWIAVAHHADDQAETVLMRMLRGTGIRGMQGMLPVNDDVIRPFLRAGRQEIEDYLAECGQDFVTDETNFSGEYTRNALRLFLIPAMRESDPAVTDQLLRLAVSSQVIYEDMRKRLPEIEAFLEIKEEAGGYSFSAEKAKRVPRLFLYEVLLDLFGRLAGGRKDFGRVHAAATAGLTEKETGKKVSLPGGFTAVREYGRIFVRREETPAEGGREKSAEEDCKNAVINGLSLQVEVIPAERITEITKKTYTKMIDYDTIKNSLLFRTPEEGDRIAVFSDGRTKKLGRFFTDSRIPASARKNWPVVADGQDIIWAVGLRLSESYKITEKTRRIAILTVTGHEAEREDI